jgi:hypothetical protein
MKTIGIIIVIPVALAAAVIALAGTAAATHVSAVITVPNEVTVGQPTEVRASLQAADGGAPVAGTPVTFFMDASFGGVSGDVELGRAVTDETGVASLTYEPRVGAEHQIRIEYMLPGEEEPEALTRPVSVIDGGSQLHRSTAGVDIPGLSVWLLIALVSTIWLILLSVALRVIAIARASDHADAVPEPATWPRHDEGRLTSESDPWAVR